MPFFKVFRFTRAFAFRVVPSGPWLRAQFQRAHQSFGLALIGIPSLALLAPSLALAKEKKDKDAKKDKKAGKKAAKKLAAENKKTFKRFCKTLSLQDDPKLIEEYKKVHAPGAAWPEITAGMRAVSRGLNSGRYSRHGNLHRWQQVIHDYGNHGRF